MRYRFVADGLALGALRYFASSWWTWLLEIVGLEVDRGDQVLARLRVAAHRPRLDRGCTAACGEFHRLHHLADEAVGHDDDGVAVPVRQFEGQDSEVAHLLHGLRRQHELR